MNKILTTALVLGALYGTANAIEIKPYVGLDAGYNKMDVKDVEYDGKSDSKKFNYGLNAGVKFELENNLFASAELYYRLGKLADLSESGVDPDPYIGEYARKLEIKNTFGAKLYFGYEFNDKLNAFVSFGLNRMNLESKYEDEYYYAKYTNNKFAPSYGLGVSYKIIDSLEAKLSYEYLDYKISEELSESVKFNTHSIRLGVNYLF